MVPMSFPAPELGLQLFSGSSPGMEGASGEKASLNTALSSTLPFHRQQLHEPRRSSRNSTGRGLPN
jgi:hypothetical protein